MPKGRPTRRQLDRDRNVNLLLIGEMSSSIVLLLLIVTYWFRGDAEVNSEKA